ncbi:MarR family transcriptional regulator [Actinomadura rugatobispora]|uniref:MarR family transcriptional regulator n=1 Tax=Actinomadura rugatobispora TaxID=1994 RepID=A0ABW0ZTL7_9ACTN|nr:helix-turn-helix domain-containing protein [Actinomadura rugatobispora]
MEPLTQQDFATLLEFRTRLRRFLAWSEQHARAAGVTPRQHQLLLAIKGHGGSCGPTIGELADYLMLRHHSTVELVDRAEEARLVARDRDAADARVIRVRLRPDGERILTALTRRHLIELGELAPVLDHLAALLEHLGDPDPQTDEPGRPAPAS